MKTALVLYDALYTWCEQKLAKTHNAQRPA